MMGDGGQLQHEVILPQRRLNMTFFAVTLMVITTIQWITLDMYLPALPVLKEELHTSEAMMNISLNTGLALSGIGTLFSGTLSDRFGRKPILLAGLFISAACNFMCAFAGSVLFLSVMRGIAGLGSGCAETVTAAMLKDSFTGKRFQRAMTFMQSIAALGPLFAPTLGSMIINVASWHSIFYFLGISTAITAIPIIISTETWPKEKRISEKMTEVLREGVAIAKTPAFALLLGITAFLTIPVWAYIAVSSYVFIDDFSVSNVAYGIYYGVGAGMSMIAPFFYMVMVRRWGGARVVGITMAMTLAGGIMLLAIGRFHPVLFLLSIVPIMLSEGMIRPLSVVVLLDEYSYAAGSASSIMHFIINLVGIIGTTVATLHWHSMITGTGIITLVCVLLGGLCAVSLQRRRLLKQRLGY